MNARDEEFMLMNRGDRAYEHGEIYLEGDEVRDMNAIQLKNTGLL